MNHEDIMRMARDAHGPITGQWWDMDVAALERFAQLVAQAEREACAKVCDKYDDERYANAADLCANAIRARGSK